MGRVVCACNLGIGEVEAGASEFKHILTANYQIWDLGAGNIQEDLCMRLSSERILKLYGKIARGMTSTVGFDIIQCVARSHAPDHLKPIK